MYQQRKDNQQAKVEHHKIDLPKGGGAISGIGEKFEANAVTGTGTMSVPIPLSPSRSGFAPKLSLTYDSGQGNSVFGLGWDVDIPSITRKTSKRLPRYFEGEESDVFLLSGAEDLVPVEGSPGLYRPRIEGLFARIEKLDDGGGPHWQATTKDNVTSIYGRSSDCRIADPADPKRVFEWLLEETFDAKGNRVVYEYKDEDLTNVEKKVWESQRQSGIALFSNKHVKQIKYGPKKNNPDEFHFTVLFDYGEHGADINAVPALATETQEWPARQDPFSEYKPGFERRTYRLCRRIVMFHDFPELDVAPVPVRELRLGYGENPVATKLESIQQVGYKANGSGDYETKSFPPVLYEYTPAEVDPSLHRMNKESLENLPQGLGGTYQWVDLEGEGLSGVFTEQAGAFYYKPNLGGGKLGPLKRLAERPNIPQTGAPPQLTDIDGDGNLELVVNTPQLSGFYAYVDGKWENFRSFSKRLNINISSPEIKQIDLTGDGRPDLLMAEDNVFTWHESLMKEGFGKAYKTFHPGDEDKGPRVVFAEAVQTIFLADMSGDGLTDIVRIRNGAVCYWPNLGYGRFGAKVTMQGAPWFAGPDQFNPSYIKLGDVDGSGTTDIFYLAGNDTKYWLNQSGNSLSEAHEINFMHVDSASTVNVIDLLGKGTSCLVWSSVLPGLGPLQMSYLDLQPSGKPHLLTKVVSNMGKVVNITYAPSTEDYLRDKNSAHPWITKLPFPVHVLREVETVDEIGDTVHHARYKYHHGYFDGPEREFRGFGMVETLDTKAFEKYEDTDQGEHYVKPVLTKTWFHNGAFLKQEQISKQYVDEYYEEVGDVLPDTVLADTDLTSDEHREAHRALKGRTLRQEIWEYDTTTGEVVGEAPYTVAESNFTVTCLQTRGENKSAVFRVDPKETITWHFEQNPADPRIAHDFTLDVDEYGNVLNSCAVVYPRKGGGHATEQTTRYTTCAVNTFIEPIDTFETYLHSIAKETKRFELVLPVVPIGQEYYLFSDVADPVDTAVSNPVSFETPAAPGNARLLTHQRFNYWNDGTAEISPQALLKNVESMAFTDDITANAFEGAVTASEIGQAGYVHDGTNWWNPGLTRHYLGAEDFYLPFKTEDFWGNNVTVDYDPYRVAPVKTTDAVGNTATAEIDYRTLSPWQLTDANENKSEAITDPLGMVIATSIYGTEYNSPPPKGDTPLFDASTPYVVQVDPTVDDVIADPHKYLQEATTFFFYDLDAWKEREKPPQAVGLAREKHVSDISSGELPKVQKSISYSDGFGREIQSKRFAEDGHAWKWDDTQGQYVWDESTEPRWIASGRTVYNNKEKPVKQYEPFYTRTHEFEDEAFVATFGVTPIIHYDPLLRVIRTDTPKGFVSTVEFTPWEVRTFDENDNVTHADCTYYQDRATGIQDAIANGTTGSLDDESKALLKTLAHANTPSVAHLDTLGRQFKVEQTCAIPDKNQPWTAASTRTEITYTAFDITGKPLWVKDARQYDRGTSGVKTFEYTYDMLQATLRTKNIDAGDDKVLKNVIGNPVISLDAKGHKITAAYDAVHRLTSKRVEGGGLDNFVERLEYGEGEDNDTGKNLRGRLFKHYDQAGRTEFVRYDFHGQPQEVERRLRADYKNEANWSDNGDWDSQLVSEPHDTVTTYDALVRPTQIDHPDGSQVQPEYHQSGRLNQIRVKVTGESDYINYVGSISYNAKSQREQITYLNNTRTDYEYEDTTFRLTSLKTRRTSGDNKLLQDIGYTYDPTGNIVQIEDTSHQRILTNNQSVEPKQTYLYDSLYRLVHATGREHPDLNANSYKNVDPNSFKQSLYTLLNDSQLLNNYYRDYTYDSAGNLTEINHVGHNNYTREIIVHENSNRSLLRTQTFEPNPTVPWVLDPADPNSQDYFDANGNQKKFDHLVGAEWNYRDNLKSVTIIERSGTGNHDAEYYVYDAAGQRTRKVKETFNFDETVKRVEEKIYLGGVEIKRIKTVDILSQVETAIFDRSDLHVMDDKQRIAIVNHWNLDSGNLEGNGLHVDTNRPRFQYSNHLGSASLELDSNGMEISYEEYFPYGGTAIIAGNNQTEVKMKEYRYVGKERDDSTGFYYHGARYYAPWIGRWLSADSAGPVDGPNLYVYVKNNPLVNTDPNGFMTRSEDWSMEKATVTIEKGDTLWEVAENITGKGNDWKELGISETVLIGQEIDVTPLLRKFEKRLTQNVLKAAQKGPKSGGISYGNNPPYGMHLTEQQVQQYFDVKTPESRLSSQECVGEANLIFAKGLIDTLKKNEFNTLYRTTTNLPLEPSRFEKPIKSAEELDRLSKPGDWIYIKNHPDYGTVQGDQADWQGENVIKTGKDKYLGQGVEKPMSYKDWEKKLLSEMNKGGYDYKEITGAVTLDRFNIEEITRRVFDLRNN